MKLEIFLLIKELQISFPNELLADKVFGSKSVSYGTCATEGYICLLCTYVRERLIQHVYFQGHCVILDEPF